MTQHMGRSLRGLCSGSWVGDCWLPCSNLLTLAVGAPSVEAGTLALAASGTALAAELVGTPPVEAVSLLLAGPGTALAAEGLAATRLPLVCRC